MIPVPAAPDSECVIVVQDDGSCLQHYFDSRGLARLYEMTYDGQTWTLERTKPDFSPLDFCQRYIGRFAGDRNTIAGEWQSSTDGVAWTDLVHMTHLEYVVTEADEGMLLRIVATIREAAPNVRLIKLNSDVEQAIASRLGIRSIPTMILFRNGKEVGRTTGAMSAGNIVGWVRRQLPALAA